MRPIHAAKLGNHTAALHALNEDGRLRGLKPRAGIDFVSNDYLALASAPRMKKAVSAALHAGTSIGAGGSRLLRGNCEEHESLEAEAAQFLRSRDALFFGGGYVANFALLTTLPQRGDLLVLDSLVHASVHEGARAGRADFRIVGHNDPHSFEKNDSRLACERRNRPRLDRGRKHLQHGWRFRTAQRGHRDCAPVRCVSDGG